MADNVPLHLVTVTWAVWCKVCEAHLDGDQEFGEYHGTTEVTDSIDDYLSEEKRILGIRGWKRTDNNTAICPKCVEALRKESEEKESK